MKNETARREIESLDYYLQNHTDDYSEESHTAMMMAIKALEQEPKTGCWIYQKGYVPYKWKCNQCSADFKTDFKYCPNCGCRMVEPQESEDKK